MVSLVQFMSSCSGISISRFNHIKSPFQFISHASEGRKLRHGCTRPVLLMAMDSNFLIPRIDLICFLFTVDKLEKTFKMGGWSLLVTGEHPTSKTLLRISKTFPIHGPHSPKLSAGQLSWSHYCTHLTSAVVVGHT